MIAQLNACKAWLHSTKLQRQTCLQPPATKVTVYQLENSQCIASDDARLKGK